MSKSAGSHESRKSSFVTVGDEIKLPNLAVSARVPAGMIRRHLRDECVVKVTAVTTHPLPGRSAGHIVGVDTGEEFVMSTRKNVECPIGRDGVLYLDQSNGLSWVHHKSIEAFQKVSATESSEGWEKYRSDIASRYAGIVRFCSETVASAGKKGTPGLRPPQVSALHSIVAHWELETEPCTVVMPTGTGKTEVMLATTVEFANRGTVLVVVPSAALRDQTAGKLLTLGLLRQLGVIPEDTPNPIVGIIAHRPKNKADLAIFQKCHVVVATMASLTQGTADPLLSKIASCVETLVIDEAHHIAAATWSQFREAFRNKRILQLTATPFRRDGKLVDGKVIFNYSLARAQRDGYFKKINFKPVFEYDPIKGDEAIAEQAVGQLLEDLTSGFEHLIMARCESVARATEVLKIYQDMAPQQYPVLIHSDMGAEGQRNLDSIKLRKSRIVVCVNMLGEGFDLPNLKIAAIHDAHKSLAVLLQFTGRFTRSSGIALGDATVIANIADQDFSTSLERLYQEDADWNGLLSEFSSTAAKQHRELIDFLNKSERLDSQDDRSVQVSHTLLRPKCSAAVFRCSNFDYKLFYKSLPERASVKACWYHKDTKTLYFVTRRERHVDWTRSKEVHDVAWDLFIVHYQEAKRLLFIASSDKSSLHESLATCVGGEVTLIRGDIVFRAFADISRLRFNQIGVKKAGRRNLSYAMYTGADVQQALTVSQKANAYKSNLAGYGFRNGEPANVGCSYKGRVWSMDRGTVRTFIDWCGTVGEKLLDSSIDTEKLIENVLVPEEIEILPPDTSVLSVDWPNELRRHSFDRTIIRYQGFSEDLSLISIEHLRTIQASNEIHFRLRASNWECEYSMTISPKESYRVTSLSSTECRIKTGGLQEMTLADYFQSYPPLFLLSDLSEIDGNLWVRPNEKTSYAIPDDRFEAWDWSGVDIERESMWKDGKHRPNSVQQRVAEELLKSGSDLLFDDDAAGEAADLVSLRELPDYIELTLCHCKFSGATEPGDRVKDVVEVCSQAIRSAKWKWAFNELCKHIQHRENRLAKDGRATRYLKGNGQEVNRFLRLHKGKEVRTRIVVVQPGLKRDCTDDQRYVLAATDSYLLETIGTKLEIICS